MKFRKEKDSMGEIDVPEDKYYGAQTQRSLNNFKIGGEKFQRDLIRAYGIVKKAAASVNNSKGKLDSKLAGPIKKAAEEVIDGKLDAFLNKVKIVSFDKLGSELAETLALIKRSGIDL